MSHYYHCWFWILFQVPKVSSWLTLPSDYGAFDEHYKAFVDAKAWDSECSRKEKAGKQVQAGRQTGKFSLHRYHYIENTDKLW